MVFLSGDPMEEPWPYRQVGTDRRPAQGDPPVPSILHWSLALVMMIMALLAGIALVLPLSIEGPACAVGQEICEEDASPKSVGLLLAAAA
ncbi:MAG: hypothetical protein AAF844_05730 [Pseudomonadota bacterium]